jgi:hypothetical protein
MNIRDTEVYRKGKISLILIRNFLLWLCPFFIFLLLVGMVWFFLKGTPDKYIELTKVLIWPITVLISLFFFRKVFTYMFFSMDEFNFFGVKGDLKNVNQMINEEAEKRIIREKEELATKEEMKKLEDKFNNTSTSAEENLQLARDVFKLYQDYKSESEKKIQDLTFENKILKENPSQSPTDGASTPIIATDQITADLGTGERIEGQTGMQP